MLWIGNSHLKQQMFSASSPLKTVREVHTNRALKALHLPSLYFQNPRTKTTIDQESGRIVHIGSNCGDKFLGMARLPLPEDKLEPTSRWRSWTHFIHWKQSYVSLPTTEEVFEFLSGNLRSYPENPTELSRQIIEQFKIQPTDYQPKTFHHYFPWLHPDLRGDLD
jgi:hypothetical protein